MLRDDSNGTSGSEWHGGANVGAIRLKFTLFRETRDGDTIVVDTGPDARLTFKAANTVAA